MSKPHLWCIATLNLQSFFGRIVDLYHTSTRLGVQPPEHGPTIFVANHPNGLIDPIVVAKVVQRRLLFLAKAPLFKVPVLGAMARSGGAIPVYRKVDGDDTGQNSGMFQAVFDSLAEGRAICLFPEGISHNLPELQRLKTGAARMALGAEAEHEFVLDIKIVPVGLTYRSKTHFRSNVAAEIGPAIRVRDWQRQYEIDPWQAVESLTRHIADGMKAVTLNLQQWEDLPLLELTEALLPEDGDHKVQRLRSFAAAGLELEKLDPERLVRLRERLAVFRSRLDNYGLDIHHLDAAYNPRRIVLFVFRNLISMLIGVPAVVLGTIAYLPPLLAVNWVLRRRADPDDIFSTIRLLAAMLFFPIWQIVLTLLISNYMNWLWALISLIVLPLAGLSVRSFARRRNQALREAWVFLTMPFQGRQHRLLIREKQRLQTELASLAQALEDAEQKPAAHASVD
jgi:glycerol-3-phosphate O-acyltransferase / dihydroxyacetone phosphate acyltransferase